MNAVCCGYAGADGGCAPQGDLERVCVTMRVALARLWLCLPEPEKKAKEKWFLLNRGNRNEKGLSVACPLLWTQGIWFKAGMCWSLAGTDYSERAAWIGIVSPSFKKALHISRGQTAKSSSSKLGKVVQDIIFTKSTLILLTQPNLGRLASYV